MVEYVEGLGGDDSSIEEIENLHVDEHIEKDGEHLIPGVRLHSHIINLQVPDPIGKPEINGHNYHLVEDHSVDLSPDLFSQNIAKTSIIIKYSNLPLK